MNPLSDAHLHTTFCDGEHTPAQMAEAAAERGMHSLGICCHSPFPFPCEWTVGDREDAFKAEITRLKEAYRGSLSISLGCESDSYSPLPRGYDYLISSVHCLMREGVLYPVDESPADFMTMLREGFGGDPDLMGEVYFARVAEAVEACRPQMVGHFDLLFKYEDTLGLGLASRPRILAAAEGAIERILRVCPRFELNTGAMHRIGRTEPYPCTALLERIRRLGGRIILSSDSHRKDTLLYAFPEMAERLRSMGFETLDLLRDGQFVTEAL